MVAATPQHKLQQHTSRRYAKNFAEEKETLIFKLHYRLPQIRDIFFKVRGENENDYEPTRRGTCVLLLSAPLVMQYFNWFNEIIQAIYRGAVISDYYCGFNNDLMNVTRQFSHALAVIQREGPV